MRKKDSSESLNDEIDHTIFDHLQDVFKKMMSNLWFAATIQYRREQQGSLVHMYSKEDGSRDLERDTSSIDALSRMIRSEIMTDVSPSKFGRSEVFLVPSVAVEISVVEVLQDGSKKNLTVQSPFFDSPQYIRLHLTKDKVLKEKNKYTKAAEADEEHGIPPAKFDFFSQWGSTAGAGPCGIKCRLHVESVWHTRDNYGLLQMMKPISISDNIEEQEHPSHEMDEDDWDTNMVTPVLSGYETSIRGFDKSSQLWKNQKQCLENILTLSSDVDTGASPSGMHKVRKKLLGGLVGFSPSGHS